jgi:hypothetical protein
MDLVLFAHLTPDQQVRYKELEKLFTSPGWALFQEFAALEAQAQLERLISASTWETNRLATGARAAYTHVANLQEITELQFSQLAEAAREAEEGQDEAEFE